MKRVLFAALILGMTPECVGATGQAADTGAVATELLTNICLPYVANQDLQTALETARRLGFVHENPDQPGLGPGSIMMRRNNVSLFVGDVAGDLDCQFTVEGGDVGQLASVADALLTQAGYAITRDNRADARRPSAHWRGRGAIAVLTTDLRTGDPALILGID